MAFTADTVTALTALGLTSNGATISYVLSTDGQTLTASAASHAVFTVQLSDAANGSYTFTLLDNLDHASGNGANNLALTFSFTATDSDGDTTAPASFTVNVTDDVPTIGTPDAESVIESTASTVANSPVLSQRRPRVRWRWTGTRTTTTSSTAWATTIAASRSPARSTPATRCIPPRPARRP